LLGSSASPVACFPSRDTRVADHRGPLRHIRRPDRLTAPIKPEPRPGTQAIAEPTTMGESGVCAGWVGEGVCRRRQGHDWPPPGPQHGVRIGRQDAWKPGPPRIRQLCSGCRGNFSPGSCVRRSSLHGRTSDLPPSSSLKPSAGCPRELYVRARPAFAICGARQWGLSVFLVGAVKRGAGA
jgi:hypothetical protein